MIKEKKILIFAEYTKGTGTNFYLEKIVEFYQSKQIYVEVVKLQNNHTEILEDDIQSLKKILNSYTRINDYVIGYKKFKTLKEYVRIIDPYYVIVSIASEGKFLYLNLMHKNIVFVFHSLPSGSSSAIKKAVKILIFKLFFRKNVTILPISQATKDRMIKSWKISKNIIWKVIHTTKGKQIEISERHNSTIIVLTAGEISYQKGINLYVDVAYELVKMKGHKNIKFFWLGTGPQEIEVKEKIRQLKLQNYVHFLGQKNDIKSYYLNADIYFHPSRLESFGLSVLDALKFGIPAVANDIEGINEIIIHSKNGFLVNLNESQLFSLYLNLLIGDQKLRDRMGRYGQKIYNEKFSENIWNHEMNSLHHSILQKDNLY